MKAYLSLMAYCLVGTAVLTLVTGTLNYFFDLGLGLGIGGSDIALPNDFFEVLILVVVQLLLAGFFELISDLGRVGRFVKARKKTAAGLVIGFVILSVMGIVGLMGGPLGAAVEAGDTSKVKALLDSGSYEIEELNPYLYQALLNGRLEMASALMNAGADPNYRSGEFNTPLLSAAVIFFPKDSVLLLLRQEADPKAKDRLERTAVHLLLQYRSGNLLQEGPEDRLEILKGLHEKGADLKAKAADGRTPRDVAKSLNLKWALEYLGD